MSTTVARCNRTYGSAAVVAVLAPPGSRVVFTVFLLIAVVGFATLVTLEASGAVECARTSQLQLQFAWSQRRMDEVLTCWGEPGRYAVLLGLRADFVFIVGYAVLLAVAAMRLGAALAGRNGSSALLRMARVAAFGAGCAGVFDVVENLAILGVVSGATADPLGLVLGLIASVKFALVLGCLVFIGVASSMVWRRGVKSARPSGKSHAE